MPTIEQLQFENDVLKQDLKTIKKVMLSITDTLGVTTNGIVNDEVETSEIVGNILPDLMAIAKESIRPKWLTFGKKEDAPNPLLQKFSSVVLLAPLFEKYKDI